jgi:integrase
MITRNPASLAIRPKAPPKEMNFLDDNQVQTLLISLIEHRWEALFHLAVVSGMRQMEILGLKWSDLEWNNEIIKVDRQLSRKQNGEDVQFAPLKTKFSKRQVDLGERTIQMFRKHLARQQALRENAGDKWIENDLIFTNNIGGPIYYRNLLRDFKIILKRASLPKIRFHDLRHTAASLMLNNGVTPLVASRRLGHARPSITMDIYGHLIPTKQAETAELMDELVTPIELPEIKSSYPRLPTKQVSPE